LKRNLIFLAIMLLACLLARHALGFDSMVELDLRRGATGAVRFDTQNQRFLACTSSGCAEVAFK
jgi:hypothetical protein